MVVSRKKALAAAGAAGVALALVAGPALADYGPQSGDVVGVGSDTVQNIGNFLTDGDISGDGGYNSTGNVNRLVSFDATGDANDRAVYANGATTPLKLGVVLRAGTSPVQRPNGSGAGILALAADNGSQEKINFVRMSRLPKNSDLATFQAANGGSSATLHSIKIATDDLVMAGKTGGNAVAVTPADLLAIYTCTKTSWNQVGGSSTATIKPEIPQSGSGTGDTFRSDLAAINGGATVTLGGCVTTVEENDPSSLTDPNAYAPFSDGRKALFDSGYFHDVNAANGTGAAQSSGISLLYGGNATNSAAQSPNGCVKPSSTTASTLTYCDTRGLFIVFRTNDVNSTTPFQPGGTKNWVQALFFTGTSSRPYVQSAGGQTLIAAAGVQATYVDCGQATVENPGSC